MKTLIRFTGPSGSPRVPPVYSALDLHKRFKLVEGRLMRIKPQLAPGSQWCQIEEIKENSMCEWGFRVTTIVVRPLSTMN